jgi:hypothetical protein
MHEVDRKRNELEQLESRCIVYNTKKVMLHQGSGVEKILDGEGKPTGAYKTLVDDYQQVLSGILAYATKYGNSERVQEMLKALGPHPEG